MNGSETTSVRRTVQLSVIIVVIIGLYLAGSNVLINVLITMIPLWYTVAWSPPPTVDGEAQFQRMAQRLQLAQHDAWHELADRAHLIEFLRSKSPHQGNTALLPPRIASWPAGVPSAVAGLLSATQVEDTVATIGKAWRNLIVTGDEDTGKTTLLLLMLLQAEHVRDSVDATAPIPLRISLAGWPDDASMTLREWIVRRIREDYPGLLGPGESVDQLCQWLWGYNRLTSDRMLLFLDGIDVLADGHRQRVMRQVLKECDGRLTVIACRTRTWREVTDPQKHGWVELEVTAPDRQDLAAFLDSTPELASALSKGNDVIQRLWRNPRLLQLLREAYPKSTTLPGWLKTPPADAEAANHGLWSNLLSRVAWPGGLDDERAQRTLRWLAVQDQFVNDRFEWWRVPQRAAQDPELRRANRFLRLHRAGSAMAWALGGFTIGLFMLTLLLGQGDVQGYDHASHGLLAAGGLRARDVGQWQWHQLSATAILGNPLYLAALQALLALLVVASLAWFGRELEHPDGGQPQTIRLSLPSVRDLPLLIRALPRKALAALLASALVSGALEISGNSGAARQLWASCAFAAVLLALLTWLHWCAEAPTEPGHRTPAGMFAADRASTRIVALLLGSVLALAAGSLSWWFSASGRAPTVDQCLGIITAVSVAIGVGRGLFLGAGMGTPWLLRLRPGFGLGYAARLAALEHALEKRLPRGDAPLAVIGVLGLRAEESSPDSAPTSRPATSVMKDLPPQTLLRPVGAYLRLRESSLQSHLRQTSSSTGGVTSARRRRLSSRLAALAIVPTVGLALLTATGSAAVMLPRLPCFDWTAAVHPQSLGLGQWQDQPRSKTWLENGQCVGYLVPGAGGWPPDSFDVPGAGTGEQEAQLHSILAQIAAVNRKIDPNDSKAITVMFLAPLTRTDPSNAINGLWQLQGALAALKSIQAQDSLPVRLLVANSAENFTSGPSVVQSIARGFPRSGPWSIKAVIGISQSRASTREALAELPKNVPVIAASVNGRQLRRGIGSDEPIQTPFRSLSPGDDQVARAMLDPAVLEAIRERDPQPTGVSTVRIVGDLKDSYFSNELMSDLKATLNQAGGGVRMGPEMHLSETGDRRQVAAVARAMCENSHEIWLFAGRGNQLAAIDHKINGTCQPLVIAGPGAISAVAASDQSTTQLTSMARLYYYSLVSAPFEPNLAVDDANAVIAIDRSSDRATGYSAMLEAARLRSPSGCPGQPGQLGVRQDRNGQNSLVAGDDPCALPLGSAVNFCPFAGGGPCVAAAKPAATGSGSPTPPLVPKPALTSRPHTEPAVVHRPDNNPGVANGVRWYSEPHGQPRNERLPWDTRVTVLCRVPGETRDEGWVGASIDGEAVGGVTGSGFIRWKVRLKDRNVYLAFPLLGGKLSTGEVTAQPLPSTLPLCANRVALDQYVRVAGS